MTIDGSGTRAGVKVVTSYIVDELLELHSVHAVCAGWLCVAVSVCWLCVCPFLLVEFAVTAGVVRNPSSQRATCALRRASLRMKSLRKPTMRELVGMPEIRWLAIKTFLATLGLILTETVFPEACGSGIIVPRVIVTDDNLSPLESRVETKSAAIVLYNLTNGWELLHQSPTPKPVFQEVTVQITRNTSAFDYTVSDDGESYSYKSFNYFDAIDQADLDLHIVTLNVLLYQLIAATPGLGSETALPLLAPFAPNVAALLDRIEHDINNTLPDGTGPTGGGIFRRYTVRELFFGYYDPVLGINQVGTSFALGSYNLHKTQEELAAALTNGTDFAYKYTDVRRTGKANADDAGRLVSFRNLSGYSNDGCCVIDPGSGTVRCLLLAPPTLTHIQNPPHTRRAAGRERRPVLTPN